MAVGTKYDRSIKIKSKFNQMSTNKMKVLKAKIPLEQNKLIGRKYGILNKIK